MRRTVRLQSLSPHPIIAACNYRISLSKTRRIVPYTPDALANYFLDLAEEAKRPLTNMEVQKLVFYAHAWHLAIQPSESPLIAECIEAWDYGPVLRSLYRQFSRFKDKPIGSARAKELQYANGEVTEYVPNILSEGSTAEFEATYASTLLDWVWKMYGRYDGIQLSKLTHAEGEPWRIVIDKYEGKIPRGLHIPNSLIRECFQKKQKLMSLA